MKEIEAKFLDIDINAIRKKIKLNNGTRIHKLMLYKRYVFVLLMDIFELEKKIIKQ